MSHIVTHSTQVSSHSPSVSSPALELLASASAHPDCWRKIIESGMKFVTSCTPQPAMSHFVQECYLPLSSPCSPSSLSLWSTRRKSCPTWRVTRTCRSIQLRKQHNDPFSKLLQATIASTGIIPSLIRYFLHLSICIILFYSDRCLCPPQFNSSCNTACFQVPYPLSKDRLPSHSATSPSMTSTKFLLCSTTPFRSFSRYFSQTSRRLIFCSAPA